MIFSKPLGRFTSPSPAPHPGPRPDTDDGDATAVGDLAVLECPVMLWDGQMRCGREMPCPRHNPHGRDE